MNRPRKVEQSVSWASTFGLTIAELFHSASRPNEQHIYSDGISINSILANVTIVTKEDSISYETTQGGIMRKTLIVAQGLEYERILAAIHATSASRLVVLRSKRDVNQELTVDVEKNLRTLSNRLFPSQGPRLYPFLRTEDFVTTNRVNFFDLPAAIVEIDQIIRSEKAARYEVTIDISTGNKIVAVALYLAAQFNKVPVTYCSAGKYSVQRRKEQADNFEQDQIAFSAEKSYELPMLPLKLDPLHFDVLEKVAKKGEVASITDLVTLVEGTMEVGKSDLMRFSRIAEELIDYGYMTRRRSGRVVEVRITDAGKAVYPLGRLFTTVGTKK